MEADLILSDIARFPSRLKFSPWMYPADSGRINPTPSHFARNTPVELHPPVSSRLLDQRYAPQHLYLSVRLKAPFWTRHLDREGRAICRIVYAHGLGIQFIASVFCVSEETVIRAIENKQSSEEHDKAENDYYYVNNEYRNQYPRLPKPGEQVRSSFSGFDCFFI